MLYSNFLLTYNLFNNTVLDLHKEIVLIINSILIIFLMLYSIFITSFQIHNVLNSDSSMRNLIRIPVATIMLIKTESRNYDVQGVELNNIKPSVILTITSVALLVSETN